MRAEFSLDYDVLTVERPQKLYLLARFAAGSSPDEATRRPLNLSLVIDRSGSMAGDKIDYTRQAAQFLVQHLGSRDTFSIVLYNDQVETLLPPEVVSSKDDIIQRLGQIRVKGTTNLSGGWLTGCNYVSTNHRPECMNRVLLMTDGLANRGVTETDQLVQLARQKRETGVATTTMGLGEDFNEDLLMAMADAGGGAYYFIESPESAPDIFHEELSGLLRVVGQNLVIAIDTGDQVAAVSQLNAYPQDRQGRTYAYQLGDIYGDETKTLVLELSIPAMQVLGEIEIARLRFEYDEIGEGGVEHRTNEMPVMVNVRDASGAAQHTANPEVAHSVLLLRAAHARREAVKAADSGDYRTASDVLRSVAEAIEQSGLTDDALDEEYRALTEQANRMKRGARNYDPYSRKTMVTQSYYTMTSRHEDTMLLRQRELQRSGIADAGEEPETGAPPAPPEEEVPEVPAASPEIADEPPTALQWRDQQYALDADLIRIGRSHHNEIVIDARGVSRFHCHIRRQGAQWILEDLGSTNGTYAYGQRIKDSYMLRAGDVIYVCNEKLVFQRETQ